jgi:hypothetical protein
LQIEDGPDSAPFWASLKLPSEIHGMCLCVVLDDRWCRSFSVAAPANVTSLSDMRLCTQARMDTLFGGDPAAWRLQAAIRAQGAFAACAIPQTWLAAARALAQEAGCTLAGLRSAWVHAHLQPGAGARCGWWAVQQGLTTTFVHHGRAGVDHVRTVASESALDATAFGTLFKLEVARSGVPKVEGETSLRVLPVPAPALPSQGGIGFRRASLEGIETLDFARSSGAWQLPRWPRGWPAFAAAPVLAVTVLLATEGWKSDDLKAQSLVTAIEKLALPRSAAAADAPEPVQVGGHDLATNVVAAAVQRLNMPWPALLGALESTHTDRVALLRLGADAQRQRLSGTGLALDEAAMFDYVGRLRGTAPWLDARVTRHETEEHAEGRRVRFSFEAVLKTGPAAAGTDAGSQGHLDGPTPGREAHRSSP